MALQPFWRAHLQTVIFFGQTCPNQQNLREKLLV